MCVKRNTAFVKRQPIDRVRFRCAHIETEDDWTPMTTLTEEVTEAVANQQKNHKFDAANGKELMVNGFISDLEHSFPTAFDFPIICPCFLPSQLFEDKDWGFGSIA